VTALVAVLGVQPGYPATSDGDSTGSRVGGSALAPLRGTLAGAATTLGRVTLTHKGKRVSSLKAGRYKLVVVDNAPHSGFILDRPNFTSITVTSTPFVGKRTTTVALTPGSWSFHGAVGALHEFTVVA
jgi:hypothetical protein